MSRKNLTLDDMVFIVMRSGLYYTFWELQSIIQERSGGKFYGEPSISAAIRNLRKDDRRAKYKLPRYGEVVERKRRKSGKGYKYRLIMNKGESNE
jgi:hypothetical protein